MISNRLTGRSWIFGIYSECSNHSSRNKCTLNLLVFTIILITVKLITSVKLIKVDVTQ